MMLLGKVVSLKYFNSSVEFSNKVWGNWNDNGVYLNLACHLRQNKIMKKTKRRSIKKI